MCSTQQQETPGSGLRRAALIAALIDSYDTPASEEEWLDDVVELNELKARISAIEERRLANIALANEPLDYGDKVRVVSPLADELAPMLAISPGSADARLQRAQKMCVLSPGVHAALRDGILPSITHVAKYLEGLGPIKNPDVIKQIEDYVLPKAARKTPEEIKKLVTYAAARFDTEAETNRFTEARKNRSVRVFHHAHGMSSLYFTMRSEHAMWINDFLRKMAKRMLTDDNTKDALDDTTMGQAMSDLAVQNFLNAANHARPSWPAAAPTTWEPGPSSATSAPEPDGPFTGLTGPAAPAPTPQPAPRYGPHVPGMSDVDEDTLARFMGEAEKTLATRVGVVLDLETALGLADNPGDLRGYGPIPGPLARDIARNATTWRAFLTDHITKELIGLGLHSYSPDQLLHDFLNARDQKCRFPGCPRPPETGDKDHVITYKNGGPTHPSNMQSVCRRHHCEKTAGRWTAVMNEVAEVLWTSPHGKQYWTKPDPPANTQPPPHQ